MALAIKPIPALTSKNKRNFFRHISSTPTAHGCQEWMGGVTKSGYGTFNVGGRTFSSHRIAYLLATGKDPGEMHVCHTCDNPSCCNTNHLFLGTCEDNMRDKRAKGRHASGENNGRAKLAASDITVIRADPRFQREIAAEYGVGKSLIGYIKNRKLWSHVS